MKSITAKEIAQQVERYIIERGQSKNSLDMYHYILSVFIQFCENHNNGNFTEAMGKRCMNDHYEDEDLDETEDKDLSEEDEESEDEDEDEDLDESENPEEFEDEGMSMDM